MPNPPEHLQLTLLPEHADALRQVDLHMSFGTHGSPYILGERGLVSLGVDDASYAAVEAFTADLDSARGDVLAVEDYGYSQPWSHDHFNRRQDRIDQMAPLLQTRDFPGVRELDPRALAEYFKRARDLQVLSVIDYGEGKALEKAVPVAFADSSDQELGEIDDDLPENYHRDNAMTRRLGSIAHEMSRDKPERPQLKFLAGVNHRRGVERRLRNNDVPFRSSYFTEQRPLRQAVKRAYIHSYVLAGQPRILPSPRTFEERNWERNFQARR